MSRKLTSIWFVLVAILLKMWVGPNDIILSLLLGVSAIFMITSIFDEKE